MCVVESSQAPVFRSNSFRFSCGKLIVKMGQSSSRHQQQSQDFPQNPQPLASAFGGGTGNFGNDGPFKVVDNSQLVPSSFELSALEGVALKEDGEYFVEFGANMATLEGRMTALESAARVWKTLFRAVGYLGLFLLGVEVSVVAYRYIEARGFKPSLVHETTRLLARDIVFHPIETLKKLKTSSAHNNVVLPPNLEEQLEKITSDAKASKENYGNYPRLLMHGPNGTGKTMAAKKLAQDLGMVYASTTGYALSVESDEADPHQIFDTYGVPAINELFNWASTSEKGVLLFIDDADDFLKKRSREDTSRELEDMHEAFLRRTREHSREVMVVLATEAEQPVWLDDCQFDETMKFELPGIEERKRIIGLYFKECVSKIVARTNKSYDVEILIDEGIFLEMAKMTEGLCGSELKHLAVGVACCSFKDGISREMAIKQCQLAVDHMKDASPVTPSETIAPEVPPNGAGGKPEGIPTA